MTESEGAAGGGGVEDDADAYPLHVVDSVILAGADEVLAVTTSMRDLIVAPTPVGESPVDVVAVRALDHW